MTTTEQRLRMAGAIIDFEARRDANHHLMVYALPSGDGGGSFEVAGINERYDRPVARQLASLIQEERYDEAERTARLYIAHFTDAVRNWSSVPAVEFFLRDTAFNRGQKGAATILQMALGIKADGVVGPQTRATLVRAESDPAALLRKLRSAREDYERRIVKRDESSKFWKGLVNRWDKCLDLALAFLAEPPSPAPQAPWVA
jgi:lysozyme family protein